MTGIWSLILTTKRLGVRNLAHKYGLGYSFIYFACLSTFLARSIARLESWQSRPLRGIICSGWGLFSIVISDRFARDGDDGLHPRTYIYIYVIPKSNSGHEFQTVPNSSKSSRKSTNILSTCCVSESFPIRLPISQLLNFF